MTLIQGGWEEGGGGEKSGVLACNRFNLATL